MARGFNTSDNTNESGDNTNDTGDSQNSSSNTLQLPLQFRNYISPTPSPEEIAVESREIFLNFANEEIRRDGTSELVQLFPTYLQDEETGHLGGFSTSPGSSGDVGTSSQVRSEMTAEFTSTSKFSSRPSSPIRFSNSLGRECGHELRILADKFSKTEERKAVRKKADRVDLNSIGKEQFCEMLSQLFRDGSNIRERIVVLFFFCTDIVIRVMKLHNINLFKKFLDWTLSYLNDVVEDYGGWASVLGSVGSFIYYMAATTCFVAVTCVAFMYIRKNM